MTTQTEAFNVALDALRNSQDYKMGRAITVEAVELIEESLANHIPDTTKMVAQPEQEPVATVKRNSSGQIYIEWRDGEFAMANLVEAKFYTTPPQRKPLTNEEIMNIAKVSCIGISPHEDTLNFAKVIEAVHGIKE